MAVYTIEDTTLTAIADAIREKTGSTDTIKPVEMADEISGLSTIPDESFTLTGNASSRFINNGWNWFIEKYGDKIITDNLTNISAMFQDSDKLTKIPFNINFNHVYSNNPLTIGTYMISGCDALEVMPNIYITTTSLNKTWMPE